MVNTDIVSAMKTQILTWNMFRNDKNGMLSLLFGLFLMSIFEKLTDTVPHLIDFFKKIILKYLENKRKLIKNITNEIKPEKKSSIILEKKYINNNSHSSSELCDALLDYVSNLNSVKYVKYRNIFIINNNDEIDIIYEDKKVKLQLLNTILGKDGDIEIIILEFFSYEYELQDLRKILESINKDYDVKKMNKLGNQPYYFNEIVQSLRLDNDRQLSYVNAPKHLKFSMTAFYTNKTLDNVYGYNAKLVREQFRFFINNKDWYAKKGIPYTFGLLLSGPPGVGKTSIIKAIASETKYHLINISLHNAMTKSQLNNLFYHDKLFIEKDNSVESYIIPLNKRIYIIEDIDCLTDIVLDRNFQNNVQKKEIKSIPSKFLSDVSSKDESEKLTLSFILNLLDGVLEIPNRILIITSNFPERLDKALIRCGRIDLNIKFPKCDKNMILEMINNFYDIDLDINQIDGVLEDIYTPSSVNQILFSNKNDYNKAIEDLKNNTFEDEEKETKILNENIQENTGQEENKSQEDEKKDTLVLMENETDLFLKQFKKEADELKNTYSTNYTGVPKNNNKSTYKSYNNYST